MRPLRQGMPAGRADVGGRDPSNRLADRGFGPYRLTGYRACDMILTVQRASPGGRKSCSLKMCLDEGSYQALWLPDGNTKEASKSEGER